MLCVAYGVQLSCDTIQMDTSACAVWKSLNGEAKYDRAKTLRLLVMLGSKSLDALFTCPITEGGNCLLPQAQFDL